MYGVPKPPAEVLARIAAIAPRALELVKGTLETLDEIELIDGALDIAELRPEPGVSLVVLGDLRVDGPTLLCENTHMVVTGDMRAHDCFCNGMLYVGGALTVSELVYLCSGNDYRVHVTGDLTARILYECGTRTTIEGALHGLAITTHNRVSVGRDGVRIPHTENADAQLEATFVAEAFATDEHGNGGLQEGLYRLLAAGRTTLR